MSAMLGQTGQVNPGELKEIGSSLLSNARTGLPPTAELEWNPFLGFPLYNISCFIS